VALASLRRTAATGGRSIRCGQPGLPVSDDPLSLE